VFKQLREKKKRQSKELQLRPKKSMLACDLQREIEGITASTSVSIRKSSVLGHVRKDTAPAFA